jgi:hypothetical protein
MTGTHVIGVKPASVGVPAMLRATCTCGWNGPPRSGRNAHALAKADGEEHTARSAREPSPVGLKTPAGSRFRLTRSGDR